MKVLDRINIEFCNNIRMYGDFIARYDMNINGTKEYDETKSILIYRYEEQTYYIVMERGEFIEFYKGE